MLAAVEVVEALELLIAAPMREHTQELGQAMVEQADMKMEFKVMGLAALVLLQEPAALAEEEEHRAQWFVQEHLLLSAAEAMVGKGERISILALVEMGVMGVITRQHIFPLIRQEAIQDRAVR
jgi:hypothetical protein